VPPAMFASIAVLTTSDILIAYLPAYGERVGLSVATVGFLLSTRAIASLGSRLLLTWLVGIVGHGRLLALSTVLPAATLVFLPVVGDSLLLYAIIAIAGFGIGMGQPLSLIWVTGAVPARIRATTIGVRLSGNRLGQVVVPTVAGALAGVASLSVI